MHVIRLAAFLFALLASAAVAHAHAYLDHASPAAGAVVTTSPSEVRMWFTQALEPRFSTAELQSADDTIVAAGAVDSDKTKEMVIRVKGLSPGKYKVIWKAQSVDTHRTEGSFSFEVKP